jgi:hypothetical protein
MDSTKPLFDRVEADPEVVIIGPADFDAFARAVDIHRCQIDCLRRGLISIPHMLLLIDSLPRPTLQERMELAILKMPSYDLSKLEIPDFPKRERPAHEHPRAAFKNQKRIRAGKPR